MTRRSKDRGARMFRPWQDRNERQANIHLSVQEVNPIKLNHVQIVDLTAFTLRSRIFRCYVLIDKGDCDRTMQASNCLDLTAPEQCIITTLLFGCTWSGHPNVVSTILPSIRQILTFVSTLFKLARIYTVHVMPRLSGVAPTFVILDIFLWCRMCSCKILKIFFIFIF